MYTSNKIETMSRYAWSLEVETVLTIEIVVPPHHHQGNFPSLIPDPGAGVLHPGVNHGIHVYRGGLTPVTRQALVPWRIKVIYKMFLSEYGGI